MALLIEFGGPAEPPTVSGHLVGTGESFFYIPDSLRFAGVTIKNAGETHWHITGGVVPGLGEFKTSFDSKNTNTDRPGSPAYVFENIGKHRAMEGVQRANLHYKGIADLGMLFFSDDY